MTAGKPPKRTERGGGGGRDRGPEVATPGKGAPPLRARVARRPRSNTPKPVLIDGRDPLDVLGRRVNELRVARNLSQEELAGRAGLDRTYVSAIERGKANPTLIVLLRLAQALDVSLDALVEVG